MAGNGEDPKRGLDTGDQPANEICDICGSDQVSWRKCKLICLNCGTILKSCADL